MRNRILSTLFVCSLMTAVISGLVIADSVESVPLAPCITAAVSLIYAAAFCVANYW